MKLFGTKRKAAHLQKKKRGRFRPAILVLLILLAAGSGAYVLLDQYVRPPDVPAFVPPRPIELPGQANMTTPDFGPEVEVQSGRPSGIYTVLIIGEEDSGGGRTDTLIFAAIDTINGGLTLVNIPRDLMTGSWSGAKINSILPARGLDALLEEVESLVGFMPDHHVIVNLDAFIQMVDAIGGVYFDVPMRMEYDDPYRSHVLHIRLNPGRQHLNGQNALNVFRFRQNNDGTGYALGDIDRIVTQQNLLRAIAEELLQLRNVLRIPELASIVMEHVRTDLPIGTLVYYAQRLRHMDSEEINFITMPVNYDYWRNGVSYVLVEPEAWLEVINRYLNPYPMTITEENVSFLGYRDGHSQRIGEGWVLTPPGR